ncbi:hypothetical protein NC653_037718 [Populus alba x Populus x berolinensis]|uniref:Uncharacterized protein n=1 Tax=Populus alba x Populus x berolinensis TaxID=444605 RepID=A0AAD6LEX6_9ROSI|nr:hypothetical protein NC653_037718 [Populus alba x Populus x berolinensis]
MTISVQIRLEVVVVGGWRWWVAFSRRGLPICRNCQTFCTKCCQEAEVCFTCVYKLPILRQKWS